MQKIFFFISSTRRISQFFLRQKNFCMIFLEIESSHHNCCPTPTVSKKIFPGYSLMLEMKKKNFWNFWVFVKLFDFFKKKEKIQNQGLTYFWLQKAQYVIFWQTQVGGVVKMHKKHKKSSINVLATGGARSSCLQFHMTDHFVFSHFFLRQ